MTVYIGIDGSQAQQDVCFLDEVGEPIVRVILPGYRRTPCRILTAEFRNNQEAHWEHRGAIFVTALKVRYPLQLASTASSSAGVLASMARYSTPG